jgi:hypothetical protein
VQKILEVKFPEVFGHDKARGGGIYLPAIMSAPSKFARTLTSMLSLFVLADAMVFVFN